MLSRLPLCPFVLLATMLFYRSGKNFQGHSFRGQNLTGADFSNADIRGTDFSDAILTGANFCHAQAGLQPRHRIQHTLLGWLLAGLSGFTSTVVLIFAGYLLFPYSLQPDYVLAPLVVLGSGIILAIAIVQRGLGFAFGAAIVAGVSLGALLGSFTGSLNGMAAGAIAIPSTITVSLGVIWVFAILLTTTQIIAGNLAVWFAVGMIMMGSAMGANIGIHVAVAAAQAIATQGVISQKIEATREGVMAATLGCTAAVGLSSYVSWRARQGDQKFTGIWQWAIAFTTLGGTRFQGANLTEADFSQAHLKGSDFRNANLTRTNFYLARQLHQAIVKHTILADPAVQNLVVTHRGQHQSYCGRNLKGANLAGVDLRGADLTAADISEATLTGAWLEQANLTKVQAIATNLQQAQLTGACIEAWNIDSTTQLENVVCDYLYLRHPQQERRPSSGTFAPGDFAALFQEIIHTLDLIFRNGIDQQAFNYSLHQLQVENEGIDLAVRSLEKKPNGTVIVRVDVPTIVDKAKAQSARMG